MPKTGFTHALDELLEQDTRYSRDGYLFLRDALDYTLKQKRRNKSVETRHVTPVELMNGVRLFALKEFGPMVPTVFDFWGIQQCEDVGIMVFNLIEAGIFGKNESDTLEDFKNGFDFQSAFVEPFLPEAVIKNDDPGAPDRRLN